MDGRCLPDVRTTLERAREDPAHGEILHRRIVSAVLPIAKRYFPPGSFLERADLAQLVAVRLFRSEAWAELRATTWEGFDAWARRAARNCAINELRKAVAAKRGGGLSAERLSAISAAAVVSSRRWPSREAARREEIERVRTIMEQLAPLERSLLVLRCADGLAWDDVAEVCDLPSGEAARKRYERLLEELQRRLSGGESPKRQREEGRGGTA